MNDFSMLPEENFLNSNFQLYKIGVDQKTLNLIEALLMELSLVSTNKNTVNDNFGRNKHQNIGLMEGIMKMLKYLLKWLNRVLEWKVQGNVNDSEFSMLYIEWFISKQYFIKDHLISFSYEQLLPKNSMINYLRNQQHADLAFTISQYMELLNSQFNDLLCSIAGVTPRQIEISEDIYIMFDDEGTGYIGIDQMIFLYIVLLKKQRFALPQTKAQFYTDFNRFVSHIPQINGHISLRSLKTYIIMSCASIEEINDIYEGCKEILTEFNWNQLDQFESSDEQYVFPKPFNEAFVECMNTLHQQGYVNDDDLMRDEFLNVYNIFLNEEFFKIIGQLSNQTSFLNCADSQKLQRMLFSYSLEYYNERVLSSLNIKLSQIIFNMFVTKFDQKIQFYINQFMNKYAPTSIQSYQSYDSRYENNQNQQKGSKIFQKSRQNKTSVEMRVETQKLEKENYKPKINFMEDNQFNTTQNNYHSWNESSTQQGDGQNRASLPYFQTSISQTQQSRNSVRDNSYLDNLQTNINNNIKNGNHAQPGKWPQNIQTNQPHIQSQKQQLFQQFTSQNRMYEQRESNPIEYNLRLSDLERQPSNSQTNSINKNLRNRSKSPIQLKNIESNNQLQTTYNIQKTQTPPYQQKQKQQQQQQFQVISKPPLDGRQNLRYSSQGFNNQDRNQQQMNGLSRSRNQMITHSSTSIRQVTPKKSPSPMKLHITLSNSQKQNNNPSRSYNHNEVQAFNHQYPQQVSFSKKNTSSKSNNLNKGSSSKKAKSFISMRANSVENTSMGYREQTPDKQFDLRNSNQNENSNLKNRKSSQQNNNYMQQSTKSFQNASNNTIQRSKSPQVRKTPSSQMWNKRVESFEQVMQRLTSQQGVSPMKELFKKKPFH